jgi:signal transduction histidine kinase
MSRRAVLCVAAGALGVAAEAVAYAWPNVRLWLPDLVVGLSLVACGIAARGRCGALLSSAGLAWFAANFAAADAAGVAWIGLHATYLHRALIAQAVLVFPEDRLSTRTRRAAAAAVYLIALWPALAASNIAWLLVGVTVVVAARRSAWPASVAFALAVGGVSAGHLRFGPTHEEALRLLYEAGLVATGAALAVMAAQLRSSSTAADRVVELGGRASLQDALRWILDDPSLQVVFVRDGACIDERGRPLVAPLDGATWVDPGRTAVLHGPWVDSAWLLTAPVSRALRLTAENARLHADVLEQLADLRASRRRLILARGRQQALLARRLRDGAERRLGEIEGTLEVSRVRDGAVAGAVAQARRRALEAREAIATLALGLQPPALAAEGLAGALSMLAQRSPVPVELHVDEARLDAAIEQAAFLVCSEALANVAKHAKASSAAVHLVQADGRVELEITDDGRGGADPAGSGLSGLRQRVEELGGSLGVRSPSSAGTRIRAEIPIGRAAT